MLTRALAYAGERRHALLRAAQRACSTPVRTFTHIALAALLAGCAEKLTPTEPAPPIGVPQTLTLEVKPGIVPLNGGPVELLAVVTVEPGAQLARVPLDIEMQYAGGAPIPNTYRTDAEGKVRESFYLTRPATFRARAGALERTASVAQEPAPPVPPMGPSCNGVPGPCPPPPKPPQPPVPPSPPPPAPALSVTLTATPQQVSLAAGGRVAFVASASAPVLAYQWDWDDVPATFTPDDTTAAGSVSHVFTASKVYRVRVRAVPATGDAATTSIVVAITSP